MQTIWRLVGATLLMLLAGCNSQPNMIALEGEVSYDVAFVENGRIDLIPIDGTPGASAGATIVGGKYAIPAAFGVRPDGTYQVRITGLRKTGKRGMSRNDSGGSQSVELLENFIPNVYNAQSTLKVSISALADKKNANFQLRKRP
jgi:hypothetical protein